MRCKHSRVAVAGDTNDINQAFFDLRARFLVHTFKFISIGIRKCVTKGIK